MHCGSKQEVGVRLKYKIVLRKQYDDKIRACVLIVGTNTLVLEGRPDGIIEYTKDVKKIKCMLAIKCPASNK